MIFIALNQGEFSLCMKAFQTIVQFGFFSVCLIFLDNPNEIGFGHWSIYLHHVKTDL